MAYRINWSNFPELQDFDKFRVRITSGTPNHLNVTLSTPPNITWWKAIKLVDRNTGRVLNEVSTQDNMHGPVTLSIPGTEFGTAKLVLAKAKIFGIHTEMYEIYELIEKSGNNIDLTWRTDGPDNVWSAIGSFISDVVTGVVHLAVTVVEAVVTAVESTVGIVADAVGWIAGLLLAFPIVGRVIALAINFFQALVGFVINFLLEFFFAVLSIFGVRQPQKLLRLVIVVQQDELGVAVATPDEVQTQLDFLSRLFMERANIKVIPGFPFKFTSQFNSSPFPAEQFVVNETSPSSAATLDVRCDGEFFEDDLGTVGAEFQLKMNNLFWGGARRLLGYGGPLVVFAVREFIPSSLTGIRSVGCSGGPTYQYITVKFKNTQSQYSILAHEVGHSCFLLHTPDRSNLMFKNSPSPVPPGDLLLWLNNEQVLLLRTSARCIYI